MSKYNIGDLIHASDGKTMGFIEDVEEREAGSYYKIRFSNVFNSNIIVKMAMNNDWWKENVIYAKVIGKQWKISPRKVDVGSPSSSQDDPDHVS